MTEYVEAKIENAKGKAGLHFYMHRPFTDKLDEMLFSTILMTLLTMEEDVDRRDYKRVIEGVDMLLQNTVMFAKAVKRIMGEEPCDD